MNLAWELQTAALERPDHPAVIEAVTGTSVSYRELADRADRLAEVLRGRGCGPDDVIVTLTPDDAWHVALFFATLRLGGVFSGFNRILHRDKFAADVQRLGARTVVVSPEFVEIGIWLRENTCAEDVLVLGEGGPADLPELRALALEHAGGGRVAPRREDDTACVNFTGGTSGVSKGVIFTHGTLGLSARLTIAYQEITSRDINLSFISLYHSGGIHDAVVWPMVRGTNVLTGGWSADGFVTAVERWSPSWIKAWVPTMVRDAMRHPRWDAIDLTGVRASLGGEPVPGELREVLRSRGMRVTDTYGLTESMPWAVFTSPFTYGDEHLIPSGSCGQPLPEFCEVVLKDIDTGEVVTEPGVRGEVCIRGGVVSPGYANDPERTSVSRDEEGWFHTRDVAEFDRDGWYFMRGRVDDIINAGGEKISLHEIESVLRRHPLVVDVACLGVPHERFGEIPAAVVQVSEATAETELKAVLDGHCLAELERWKRPRLYALVDEIPRTLPKRTKSLPALRELLAGVSLRDDEGVTTLAAHLATRPVDAP